MKSMAAKFIKDIMIIPYTIIASITAFKISMFHQVYNSCFLSIFLVFHFKFLYFLWHPFHLQPEKAPQIQLHDAFPKLLLTALPVLPSLRQFP